ncbi:MBL fold metallo-hydrolase [Rhodoblastus sp. 17X3]|uniref:MBL fold metallo-hydrolase n=1 Tax=Rhodoblastus sp. 17X3 TaxID=3047026 RepID=UPI0024B7BFC6|nr:MBL fold metallo-hydrolase [Rhodoblastus sp. 17X3]MDI9849521.1 MBL fold metallo-hydrolase [Rhodoblastus sp. 17X3]
MFQARIHRGADQIGGTCVELSCDGARILLELGKPLDAEESDPSLLPAVNGLRGSPDAGLLAIVISHGHIDHWGLTPLIDGQIKLAMGAATQRILKAAAPFVPNGFAPENVLPLANRHELQIGPFKITPYLVDHSAYDAYAMVIDAGGRRLFYSGDIRGHGRKSKLFDALAHHPPRSIDTMLMEGSSLGRLDAEARFPTEAEVEERFVDELSVPGFVIVSASAQNIDRIVSLYRACKRTGRTLVLDLYAMEILRSTENQHLPQAGWSNLAVYVPEYQRRQIVRSKQFDLLDPYKTSRIFRDKLTKLGPKAVMLFRPAMWDDVEKAGLWSGARAVWSQWSGYLKDGAGAKLKSDWAARNVPMTIIHTSGHADIADLRRLAEAIAPKRLVPIHTFEGDRFPEYFSNVVRRKDGEWWGV